MHRLSGGLCYVVEIRVDAFPVCPVHCRSCNDVATKGSRGTCVRGRAVLFMRHGDSGHMDRLDGISLRANPHGLLPR